MIKHAIVLGELEDDFVHERSRLFIVANEIGVALEKFHLKLADGFFAVQ